MGILAGTSLEFCPPNMVLTFNFHFNSFSDRHHESFLERNIFLFSFIMLTVLDIKVNIVTVENLENENGKKQL